MSRDLREYARQTNKRLFFGFLFLLFVVGGGLIYIMYGREAAMLGLICMLLGLLPLALVWLTMQLLSWLANREAKE